MKHLVEFKGWDALTIEDLVVAYRKAKVDCFFEKVFPTAIKFAEYEQDLLSNLYKLLKQLQTEKGFADNDYLLGRCRLLPKKLSSEIKSTSECNQNSEKKNNSSENAHIYFSNPERAVESFFKNHHITPEFRIIGDFPVDTHIISALWVNMIGHKFDAKLLDSCYGSRLKRISNDDFFTQTDEKLYHIKAIGSFVPYFQPYQKWRRDGLNAIRSELEKDRDVVAISLDLKSYYHLLDPLCLSSQELHKVLGLELNKAEKLFTKQLSGLLSAWSNKASLFAQSVADPSIKIKGGLVIGLTCSRIIANVLLHKWDKLIKEKLSPIHYGRYVDDMFLVFRDTGTIHSNSDLMHLIQERMGKRYFCQSSENHVWKIEQELGEEYDISISLQPEKQKIFVLKGRSGLDFLESIEKEIEELSSEYRLMPSPDQLEHSTAVKVLSAANKTGENADTLRKADGTTIRRLGWSLQLRLVETLSRDLPANEWKEEREDFYTFAHNHILRADKLFEHFDCLPRLLGFAINLNEWKHAYKIAAKVYLAIDILAKSARCKNEKTIKVNEMELFAPEEFWGSIKDTLSELFVDATIRYFNAQSSQSTIKANKILEIFLKYINNNQNTTNELPDSDESNILKKSQLLASTDLASEAYKYILNRSDCMNRLLFSNDEVKEIELLDVLSKSKIINRDTFEKFMNSTKVRRWRSIKIDQKINDSYLPYLFPTRPLLPSEISELAPECVGLILGLTTEDNEHPAVIWAKYTEVLRGVWVKSRAHASEQDTEKEAFENKPKSIRLGIGKKNTVIVALTNILTEDSDWKLSACDSPNLSRIRYQKISNVVNDTLRLFPKPDYVIFPELSIPLHWVNSISAKLNASGISLIAGTEYRHSEDNKIISEAVLVLSDNRLGYPSFVKIWQPKLEPAVSEDKELTVMYGKQWQQQSENTAKPIYIHNNFNFGVMICSELQNSKERINFQGNIDALMVLSWNKDLETFSSLIESAALDIHAYTILVNNRKYGDSRVRSPAKESFMRDIARVRGGDNDFVITATLDIGALRSFQSRAKRWPEINDKFKPVPEGYVLLSGRKKLPPQ